MASGIIPPANLAPSVPGNATANQCIELWADLLDTCEQFLIAGLRRSAGSDAELRQALREWHMQQRAEHDRTMLHLVEEFERRSCANG
jgi:hypothetical protein